MFILIESLLKCSIQLKFLLYLIEVKRENAGQERQREKEQKKGEKVRTKKKCNIEQTN